MTQDELEALIAEAQRRGGGVVCVPPGEIAMHGPLQLPHGIAFRVSIGSARVIGGREVSTNDDS